MRMNRITNDTRIAALAIAFSAMIVPTGTVYSHAGVAIDEGTSYSHCEPMCIVFKRVGGAPYAVVVDRHGQVHGFTPVANEVGVVLATADIQPMSVGNPYPVTGVVSEATYAKPQYAGSCGGSLEVKATVVESTVTGNTVVAVIKATVECNGSVIAVEYIIVEWELT